MLANSKDHAIYFFNALRRLCRKTPTEFYRRIEYEQKTTSWSSKITGSEQRNNILQKAVVMYLSHLELEYREAELSLMAVKEKGSRDSDTWEMQYGSTVDQLKSYRVTTAPPRDRWVEVGPEVFFMQSQNDDGEDDDEGGEG